MLLITNMGGSLIKLEDKILLAHGSGGRLTHELIQKIFLKPFKNQILEKLDDSAVLRFKGMKLAFTTDSYVVDPIFFPGGDIGKLAACGTINDLAMVGARPLYLTLSLIIEEGFPMNELKRIVASIKAITSEIGIDVVAGDTKVVEREALDKIFINTTGLGIVDRKINISSSNAKIGDKIIINGYVGDHGITIISQREGIDFKTEIKSDCAPLWNIVSDILNVSKQIHSLKDPTRGGIATVLNEIAISSNVGIIIDEAKIPIREEVKAVCELLGFDPLYVANEGKLIAVVGKEDAEEVLSVMRKNPKGEASCIIGEVSDKPKGMVILKTKVGGTRIVDMLTAEQLPRIC